MQRGLGEILAESGDITLRRLRKACLWQKDHGGTIDRALLATGAVSEETLNQALSELAALPGVSRIELMAAQPEVVSALPTLDRRRLRALPFDRVATFLCVAVSDPTNPVLETGLVAATGSEVRIFVVAEPVLDDVLEHWERVDDADPFWLPPLREPRPAPEPRVETAADPFERLARALLSEALDTKAQSIEMGTDGQGGYVRTFLDGAAPQLRRLPAAVLPPLTGWFRLRTQAEGPFDEGAFLVERPSGLSRCVRVEVSPTSSGGLWLVFSPGEPPAPAGTLMDPSECPHVVSPDDLFCPVCGEVL